MEEVSLPEGTHADVRAYLVDELQKDLMGPSRVDEILTDPPSIHYLTGILFPAETEVSPDEDQEANEAAVGDDEIDPGTLMASAFNPPAIGMTFTVLKGEEILIRCIAATYEKDMLEAVEAIVEPDDSDDSDSLQFGEDESAPDIEDTDDRKEKPHRRPRSVWKRKICEIPDTIIDTGIRQAGSYPLTDGLRLYVRTRIREEMSVVTVSLVNDYQMDWGSGLPDPYCFFQPQIEVTSTVSGQAAFVARRETGHSHQDVDRQRNRLLYRHAIEFATGHGCAVEWDEIGQGKAIAIRTVIIPAYEALQLSPDWKEPVQAQGMQFLAGSGAKELEGALTVFLEGYREWIRGISSHLDNIPDDLRDIARENISACEEASERMETGIRLLCDDALAMKAFQMANRAMLEQRARTDWLRTGQEDRGDAPDLEADIRWRPFQLAFFLICLLSLADPYSDYRDVVDLLWFPTGGGKTEAYLGLSAFTIFLRRLKADDKDLAAGVTILMRYTLRLLTLQQYQRAASMIMACEIIRRENIEDLGDEPVTLGLWVGGGATPNRLERTRRQLERLLQGESLVKENPYQILECPWCGTRMTPHDYSVGVTMTIHCPQAECEFHDGLPLYLIDDDIYRMQPSMIIGTVDKFARLPWVEESVALFGKGKKERLPPEFIIQDELHLISGPLGTLVGLYETAIDVLCTRNNIRPKVIASTATIRRAADQVKGLFARDIRQFPAQGLDIRDSFFARQVSPDERPGRLFVGIHTPGKSMVTARLRVYARLLQRINEHKSDPVLRDPYWTLVGYFNSLRELGGCVRLVEDDVRARIKVVCGDGEDIRKIDSPRELTSRVGSDEIPVILDDMFKSITDDYALDVLLATNMISVGVDVDRLGLMVVNGQPKMTSEYIQATSRVGRRYPGLIVTLYNWTRPRDRSHYERFSGYHASLYSQVEPSSVTPFSSRARDRGLHGVIITLLRHLYPELRPEEAANIFKKDDHRTKRIAGLIADRVTSVDEAERNATLAQVERVFEIWDELSNEEDLVYGQIWNDREHPHLMMPAEQQDNTGIGAFPTLNSLREVEGSSTVYLLKAGGEA